MDLPRSIFTVGQVTGFQVGGSVLSDVERRRMLEEVRGGANPELSLDAITFIQSPEPNANFTRFSPDILGELAQSFAGVPFLLDHSQNSVEARVGTVLASVLVDVNGNPGFAQTLQIVKRNAVESALDGTLDRFSIGFSSDRQSAICSVCGQEVFGFDCMHFPGDLVEMPNGTKQFAEIIITKARGVETSAVNVPAVEGTQITEIRAALSAHRSTFAATKPRKESKVNELQIVAIKLGLSAEAPKEEVLTAIDKLDTRVKAEKMAHGQTKEKLAQAEAGLAALQESNKLRAIEDCVQYALSQGKVKPDQDKVIESIRKFAEADADVARQFVDGLPKVVPVGGEMQSSKPDVKGDGVVMVTPEMQKVFKQLGISTADAIKAGTLKAEA